MTRLAALCWLTLLCTCCGAAVAHDRYRLPRLPDGHPDLQGNWDHNDATPLERLSVSPSLVITQEQALEIERLLNAASEDRNIPTEPTEFFNERHILPLHGELRSSIIVAPADGKLPWTPPFATWGVDARR